LFRAPDAGPDAATDRRHRRPRAAGPSVAPTSSPICCLPLCLNRGAAAPIACHLRLGDAPMFAANSHLGARLAIATALTILPTAGTFAHGFAGSRFFPATIVIDDPFVADELSLPTISNQKTETDPSVVQTDISGELSKRITSEFGLSIGYGWTHLDQAG